MKSTLARIAIVLLIIVAAPLALAGMALAIAGRLVHEGIEQTFGRATDALLEVLSDERAQGEQDR